MKRAAMVIDLQFGSTGKGSLVGYLTDAFEFDTAAAAWGPNAGHTYVDRVGRSFVHTMLPTAACFPWVHTILLGPGSVLNMENLFKETRAMQVALEKPRHFRIIAHPQAPVVSARHLDAEKVNVRVGSTMKGTGAALIEKIQRDPNNSPLLRDVAAVVLWAWIRDFENIGVKLIIDEDEYDRAVDDSNDMMIEGAQGYSLGIHRQFWPYTTSREVSPAQVLSDCGLPIPKQLNVYGTMRTFPIRVANRFNEKNEQIGTSGGFYSDQRELTWDEVGQEPELTTVTKLQRRVFSFSDEQTRAAIRACRPNSIFLNFCNYLEDHKAEALAKRIDLLARDVFNDDVYRTPCVDFMGFGPSILDIRRRKS